jgi:hypothetical protein
VSAHKTLRISLKKANSDEYVKLTVTELLRELGDEQDNLGNLVQSEELG